MVEGGTESRLWEFALDEDLPARLKGKVVGEIPACCDFHCITDRAKINHAFAMGLISPKTTDCRGTLHCPWVSPLIQGVS